MPAVSTRESSHARIGDVREASVGALADVVDVASLRCDRFVEGEVLRNAVRSEIDAYQLGRAGNDERLRRGGAGVDDPQLSTRNAIRGAAQMLEAPGAVQKDWVTDRVRRCTTA